MKGVVLLLAAWPVLAQPPTDGGQALFESNCSACHTLDLPRSQHLDRNTWQWVMDDMVNQFGCTWLSKEEQARIIDYLVEHHGPLK